MSALEKECLELRAQLVAALAECERLRSSYATLGEVSRVTISRLEADVARLSEFEWIVERVRTVVAAKE